MYTPQQRAGQKAEQAAQALMVARGYTILDRNFSTRRGEIDLVAKGHGVLCFVEVRRRDYDLWGGALASVTRAKQRKIALAAMAYLAERQLQDVAVRFDVISVRETEAGLQLELIPGAFEVEG